MQKIILSNRGKSQKLRVAQIRGFSVIEALIGISLVSMLVLSLYASLNGAARNMGDAKLRTGAVALASEKMETLRSLEYSKLGTEGGIPSGIIPEEETVVKNGFDYQVKTHMRYIDDTFDGVWPSDSVNTDYKQAWIEVLWSSGGQTKSVEFFSIFIPKGVETNVGGGTLSINTSTSGGQIVSGVSVNIRSVEDTPAVNVNAVTDENGNVIFPGTPSQKYRITLTKTGYENVQTYPNPPESSFTPMDADVMVTEGDLVMKTFFIDQAASLTLKAVNVADNAGIAEIDFDLFGGRKIGYDPDTYLTNETVTTNSLGEAMVAELGQGVYQVTNETELSNDEYYYLGTDSPLPINLVAGEDMSVNFIFANKAIPSLVAKVTDSLTNQPISNAQVHLTATGFDQTVQTDSQGLAYFPPTTDPPIVMEAGSYDVAIEADGYQDYSETANVSGLVVLEASMDPN